jgi:hypothetical protein
MQFAVTVYTAKLSYGGNLPTVNMVVLGWPLLFTADALPYFGPSSCTRMAIAANVFAVTFCQGARVILATIAAKYMHPTVNGCHSRSSAYRSSSLARALSDILPQACLCLVFVLRNR